MNYRLVDYIGEHCRTLHWGHRWSFDFRGPKFFDKGVSTLDVDMIAVSLACPKNPKSLLALVRVRNLIEKVGDLRGIAFLVQLNFGIFTWSNCLGLSSSILNFGYIFVFLKN